MPYPFAELIAKTNYSFLEGASSPEEMVAQAHTLGYRALGITDRHGVYGAPRAHALAHEIKFPLLIGSEITLLEGGTCFLLAKSKKGYANLCELLTLGHTQNEKGQFKVAWEDVFTFSKDLFAFLTVDQAAQLPLENIANHFPAHFYLTVYDSLDGMGQQRREMAVALSSRYKIPCIVSNLPLFHTPAKKPLHDILSSVRHTLPLRKAGFRLLANAERFLKPADELFTLFRNHEDWFQNTVTIAEECHFSLSEIKYHYPSEWIPDGHTSHGYLERLVWEGARRRYGTSVPEAVKDQIYHELKLIEDLEYSDYFLTTWDIVAWARNQDILCQGRGSAANSIVCYVLGITAIDPIRMELLFERFLSRERKEPPDIDIDFEHERREEVIQYIYGKYGRDRAAIAAEVICFRKRSAFREVAKAFEIPETTVKNVSHIITKRKIAEIPEQELLDAGIPAFHLKNYLGLVSEIHGTPRHLGTHVGGFVLCHEKLSQNVPIEKAAMPNRTIIQWDKNDLDALGFVKVDILGLGMMTALKKAFTYLKDSYGITSSLADLPSEDPKVYETIQAGDTIGVFQIESRAQMNMLPRLKPRNFFDLVVEISLIRPGPIQGRMVHPYLKRRQGLEKVEYAHPSLEKILKKTYGVPLFQEQIMKMAMEVADFTAGEADELRRAMGTWRREGGNRLSKMGEKFRQGLMRRGISKAFADQIFSQIEGFAEYGFPESHAASFAILAYASAYFKCYYPDIFLCALLNSQPMGFYSSHTLIADARRHGVTVLPVDVCHSFWDSHIESSGNVRLGFREIHGLNSEVGKIIPRMREGVQTLFDFSSRLKESLYPKALTKRELFFLATANAFRSLGLERRQALWEIQALSLPDALPHGDEPVGLPRELPAESVFQDLEATGVALEKHPVALFRPQLELLEVIPNDSLKKKMRKTSVAGMVICRQMPPTASGVLFITLEDETGFANLVIWNAVFQRYRDILLSQSFLIAKGKVEKAQDGNVYHVIVDEVSAFPFFGKEGPALPSHDFR